MRALHKLHLHVDCYCIPACLCDNEPENLPSGHLIFQKSGFFKNFSKVDFSKVDFSKSCEDIFLEFDATQTSVCYSGNLE